MAAEEGDPTEGQQGHRGYPEADPGHPLGQLLRGAGHESHRGQEGRAGFGGNDCSHRGGLLFCDEHDRECQQMAPFLRSADMSQATNDVLNKAVSQAMDLEAGIAPKLFEMLMDGNVTEGDAKKQLNEASAEFAKLLQIEYDAKTLVKAKGPKVM